MESSSTSTYYPQASQPKPKNLRSMFDTLMDMPRDLTLKRALIAIASCVILTWLYGWMATIIIMTFVYIHESGHLWAAKTLGIKTNGFLFLPIGGVAIIDGNGVKSNRDEMYISIMGPVWGLALAVFTAGIYYLTTDPIFAAAAVVMCGINLFNLVPINPLDGGRISKAIAYSFGRKIGYCTIAIGIAIAWALSIIMGSVVIWLISLVSFLTIKREHAMQRDMFPMPKADVLKSFVYLLSTIVAYILIIALMLNSLGDTNPVDLIFK